jgi:hypothetical protein
MIGAVTVQFPPMRQQRLYGVPTAGALITVRYVAPWTTVNVIFSQFAAVLDVRPPPERSTFTPVAPQIPTSTVPERPATNAKVSAAAAATDRVAVPATEVRLGGPATRAARARHQ